MVRILAEWLQPIDTSADALGLGPIAGVGDGSLRSAMLDRSSGMSSHCRTHRSTTPLEAFVAHRPGRLRETGNMSDRSHVRPRELEPLARRAQVVQANAAVIRETQARVCGHVDCDAVLMALHDGRRN